MKNIILSVLLFSVSLFSATAQIITLDNNKQLHIFNKQGKLLRTIKLLTPAKQYLSFTVADILPGNTGNELAVLRNDKYVDFYRTDFNSKSLKRINYANFSAANRRPIQIAAMKLKGSVKKQIILLNAPDKNKQQYFHIFSYVRAKPLSFKRNSFYAVKSVHGKIKAFDAANKLQWTGSNESVIVTSAIDNYLEMYNFAPKESALKRFNYTNSGYQISNIRLSANVLTILTKGNKLYFYGKKNPLKPIKTISLKSKIQFIDFNITN